MDEFNKELALILSGALVAQAVNWLQARHNKHKLKGLLLEELKQLRVELDRVAMGLERQLQIYGKKGLDSQTYVAIRAFIFDNHYKDVMTSLTMDQRISLQMTHSYISAINEMFEEQQSIVRAIYSKENDERNEHDIDNWGEHIQGLYVTANSAIWHIHYHLRKPDNPTLLVGDRDHQDYLQKMEAATKRAKEFIKAGANMDRESFEKIYDPTFFESGFENTRSE